MLETQEKREEQREKLQESLREYIKSKAYTSDQYFYGYSASQTQPQQHQQNHFQNQGFGSNHASQEGGRSQQGLHTNPATHGSTAQGGLPPAACDVLEFIRDPECQKLYCEVKHLANKYVETYAATKLEQFDGQYMEDNYEQWMWIYRISILPESVLKTLLFQHGSKQAKSHYRRLCILVHPDKTTHPLASKAFQKVLSAYQSALAAQERGVSYSATASGDVFSC